MGIDNHPAEIIFKNGEILLRELSPEEQHSLTFIMNHLHSLQNFYLHPETGESYPPVILDFIEASSLRLVHKIKKSFAYKGIDDPFGFRRINGSGEVGLIIGSLQLQQEGTFLIPEILLPLNYQAAVTWARNYIKKTD